MLESKKISKEDLKKIADMAHNYFIELAPKELEYSEFIAKCYLEACAGYLNLKNYEYEEKIPYIPADD